MSNTLILRNSITVIDASGPTDLPMTVVYFQHLFGDQVDGEVPIDTSIAAGETVELTFQGGSGSGDYYTFKIYWQIPNAAPTYQIASEARKRCDIEQEDIESPSPIVVEFFSQSFNVGTPASSGCFNNAYSSRTTSSVPPGP